MVRTPVPADRDDPPPARPRRGGVLRTLVSALLVAAPLGALAWYQLHQETEATRQTVENTALSIARANAAEIARRIGRTESLLARMAEDPDIRALDPKRCGHWFSHFREIFPQHSNLLTKDINGFPVCSGLPVPPGTRINLRNYLPEVQHNNGFGIGSPNLGGLSKRWVVPLDYPLRDDAGNIVGTVSAPLDLLNFDPLAGTADHKDLPSGTTAALFAPDMTLLARSEEAEKWVGSKRAASPDLATLVTGRAETARFVSEIDQTEKLHAAAKVPGTAWTAVAGIPTAPYDQALAERIRTWLGAYAAVAAALAGAVVAMGRRTAPADDPQALPTPPRLRTARHTATLPFLTLSVATLALFGVLFWISYQSTRAQALSAASNVAEVLAATIQDTLGRARSDLMVFVPQLTDDDLSGRASQARKDDLEARMAYHLRSFPAVLNYMVVDASGRNRFGAGAGNVHGGIDVSDRKWFQDLRSAPDREFVISQVVMERSVDTATVVLAVPVRAADGRFLGAIRAAINLGEFQRRVDRLDIGPRGLIAVRRTDDLRLVLRRPQLVEQINETVSTKGLADLIASNRTSSAGEFTSPIDNIVRLYAFRALSDYPLSVVVATSADDYLAAWRTQTTLTGTAALALVVLLTLMYRRRLAAQHHLEESEARLAAEVARTRAVLTAASDGICVMDTNGDVVETSDSFCRMLGYSRDEVLGMNVSRWDAHFSPEALREVVATSLAGDERIEVETRHRRKDGTIYEVEVTAYPFALGGQRMLFCSSRDITERKAAERRLAESEERFRSLVEGTTDWVWETDEEHRFSWISPAFSLNLGRPLSTIIGQHRWTIATDGRDVDVAWQSHKEMLGRREPFRDFRYWLLDANGRRHWISVSGTPRFDTDGTFLGYRGCGADITEKAAISARLLLFSKTIEQSPLSVVVTDLRGRIEYTNTFVQKLTGYSHDELVGRHVSLLGHGEDGAEDEMWRIVGSGGTWTGEFLNRKKDGSRYWQTATVFAVTDGDGTPIHCVSVGEDITERKRDRSALAEAHAQLNAILDNTPVGVSILSLERVVLRVNHAFAGTFGLRKDEVEGKSARIFYATDADFEDIGRRAYPQVAAGGTFSAQAPMKRQDNGRTITVNLAARLVDQNNPALGVVWVAEDITEQLAKEAELAQANRDLQQRTAELTRVNEELEKFAYVASHDLRQPLRMVASYVGLIEKRLGADVSADMKDFITFAKDGASRMDALILGLLQYSRVGRSKDAWDEVALDEVVTQSVHDLQVAAREAGATVTVAEGLPSVNGDPIELARLFQNLIGNAIKYHAPDRPPEISVTWRDEGDCWRIAVTDNGIGIPTEARERAFGIFQRLVPQDRYEGTGIGLAICKKIVECHGGRIWIEPNPTEGSTFHVTFPKMAT